MYRFLWSARWLGGLAAALAVAAVMVLLGTWQYDRYQERSAINARIDAPGEPVPLARLLPSPEAGPVRPEDVWRLVEVTGRYDPDHQVLVRGRSYQGRTGYEVVTPLVLADGSAVLVDRGWLPPTPEGPTVLPTVPAPPAGEVTVTGWLRLPESGDRRIEEIDGTLTTRRITVEPLAAHLPYRIHHGFVQLAGAAPGDDGLVPLPPRRQNAMLNAAYAVQWWLFAGLVLAGFVWLVRKEARQRVAGTGHETGDGRATMRVPTATEGGRS